jgi:hypothetical protein
MLSGQSVTLESRWAPLPGEKGTLIAQIYALGGWRNVARVTARKPRSLTQGEIDRLESIAEINLGFHNRRVTVIVNQPEIV